MSVPLLTNQARFGAWLYNDHLVTCDLNNRHIGIHNPSAAVLWILLEGAVNLELLSQDYAEVIDICRASTTRCTNVPNGLAD